MLNKTSYKELTILLVTLSVSFINVFACTKSCSLAGPCPIDYFGDILIPLLFFGALIFIFIIISFLLFKKIELNKRFIILIIINVVLLFYSYLYLFTSFC